MSELSIALDAMSGDFGPPVSVPAAFQVLRRQPELHIFLVGEERAILPFLNRGEANLLKRITFIPASKVIPNDATLSQSILKCKENSLYLTLEQVKKGYAQACVSAGNTAILMALSKIMLKQITGLIRPALIAALPTVQRGKQTLVLDLGANSECNSEMLVQFAIMGAVMAKMSFNLAKPDVSLLNIGKESTKGLKLIRTAAERLSQLSLLNYIGYIEGNELLLGRTDVLVCDGFTGNVTLKTLEGVSDVFLSYLSSGNSKKSIIDRLLSRWLFNRFTQCLGHFKPDQYNGAFLLGLKSIVIKSHGAANISAFAMAIERAMLTAKQNIPAQIEMGLSATSLIKDKYF